MTRLRVEGLSKRYGDVVALDDVSFALSERSRTAVIGRSGSGKSTLLRIIAGFEAPDRGRVIVGDEVVTDGGRSVPAHQREIGVVSQDGALFPHLSVEENIGFGLPRGASGRTARIRGLADIVELPRATLARAPHELSGGQQQRVALARALAREPRLMLLDEPFSALDTGLREVTRQAVIRILDAARVGCVLVTHDQVEALSFSDQVAVLRSGRLVQVASPEHLYRQPADADVAKLLGDFVMLPAAIHDGWATCCLGRIRVVRNHGAAAGTIMLRPDQICIRPIGPPFEAEVDACTGQVTSVQFGGALSTVSVQLDRIEGADPVHIAFPAVSLDVPRAGDRVLVTVRGEGYVFQP